MSSCVFTMNELECVLSCFSQIIKWAQTLGEAWCREVHGRRGCVDGCAALKGHGGSHVWVLRFGVLGWMGSLGELDDEEWSGGAVEKGNGRRRKEASRPAWSGRIGDG